MLVCMLQPVVTGVGSTWRHGAGLPNTTALIISVPSLYNHSSWSSFLLVMVPLSLPPSLSPSQPGLQLPVQSVQSTRPPLPSIQCTSQVSSLLLHMYMYTHAKLNYEFGQWSANLFFTAQYAVCTVMKNSANLCARYTCIHVVLYLYISSSCLDVLHLSQGTL